MSWSGLFDGTADVTDIAVATGLALGVAWIIALVAGRLVRAAFLLALGGDPTTTLASPAVRRPARLVAYAVFVATTGLLLLPALRMAGVGTTLGMDPESLVHWLLESGVRVALIAVGAYVLTRVVALVVQRFEFHLGEGDGLDAAERGKRARTLGSLIRRSANGAILAVAGLMILRELELDIMPVLTGAGILGLAVGFGAQTLVRDIISGFFMILENQIRVGDVAVINGTGGAVEAINLRTVVLRDLQGTVHVFPNGGIERLANLSRDFSYAVLDVPIPLEQDLDAIVGEIRRLADEMAAEPAYRPSMLEPLEVLGVESFDDFRVMVKIRVKTMPLKQWEVGRELRRRISRLFAARGIRVPFQMAALRTGTP